MGREDPDPLTQITALVDAGCLLMSGILVGVAIVRCVSANEWVRELGPLGKGRIPEF
jgi:hypothetical protein